MELGAAKFWERRDVVFDGKAHSYDVLYVPVLDSSGHLKKLHDLLGAEYKVKWQHADYNSHLTLAYVKAGSGEELSKKLSSTTHGYVGEPETTEFEMDRTIWLDALHFKKFRDRGAPAITVYMYHFANEEEKPPRVVRRAALPDHKHNKN